MRIHFMRVMPLAIGLFAASLGVSAEVHAKEAQCATLLTAAELKVAVGITFDEVSEPVSQRPGHSDCTFFARTGDDVRSVSLSFSDINAIRDWIVPVDSAAEFFDMNVSSTQDVTGEKGEKLSGVGVRAILFKSTEPLRIFVEMKTGFADVYASGLTPEQLKAVAKVAVTR